MKLTVWCFLLALIASCQIVGSQRSFFGQLSQHLNPWTDQFPLLSHVLSPFGADASLGSHIQQELGPRLSTEAVVLVPEDVGFAEINERYSDYKRPTYIAGVKVRTEQDVIETVNYARARGIPVVARTGGHALTTSLRRVQNAIVISMLGLDSLSFDHERRLVTIGGGVQTGAFANFTHAMGMEVTVGSCPCTGVMGISLGAGIGRLQGKYGYLHDNMVAIRLLLANGTVITASKESHADLFWAVRGAGHNFGIALSATFQVHPQQNGGVHFNTDFEFDLEQLEDVFDTVNQMSRPMVRELAIFVIGRKRGKHGKPSLNVNLVHSGRVEDAARYTRPFEKLSPVWMEQKEAEWDALPWVTYNGLNNILCTRQGWARFPIKNFYGANVRQYHVPTMRTFFDAWAEMNRRFDGKAMFSVMFESFAQQAVRSQGENATAYPWRYGSDHFLMMEAAYRDPTHAEEFDSWLSMQQDAWIKTSGFNRLQQYVNYGHGSKDEPEALYGYEPWRLERLRALKQDVDPENMFSGYQPLW